MQRIAIVHFALLLAALALAYMLPFELLVLSYAILGPAHYLTEISWLHDRKYFLPERGVAGLLAIAALGMMFIASTFWYGVVVSYIFVICAIVAASPTRLRAMALIALATLSFAIAYQLDAPFAVIGVLLPTLAHVSLFTLVFMLLGAHKARSPVQFALVAIYLLAVAAILTFPPSQATVIPRLASFGQEYFGDVAPALGAMLGIADLKFDARLTGVLSFIYTYHYLNWFIKADVVRWADVSRARLATIAGLSLGATGLYFYNYTYGFMVLVLLSLTHVLLEFPLNSISIRQLGTALRKDLTMSAGRRARA